VVADEGGVVVSVGRAAEPDRLGEAAMQASPHGLQLRLAGDGAD
jgi:hypothetical protein